MFSIRTYDFDVQQYLEDMNALLAVCHTLYHIAATSLQIAGAARRREQDYYRLLEDYNSLLHVAQNAGAWRTEAERYLSIIAALDAELRECEG